MELEGQEGLLGWGAVQVVKMSPLPPPQHLGAAWDVMTPDPSGNTAAPPWPTGSCSSSSSPFWSHSALPLTFGFVTVSAHGYLFFPSFLISPALSAF